VVFWPVERVAGPQVLSINPGLAANKDVKVLEPEKTALQFLHFLAMMLENCSSFLSSICMCSGPRRPPSGGEPCYAAVWALQAPI
jgi:hypothetical protein